MFSWPPPQTGGHTGPAGARGLVSAQGGGWPGWGGQFLTVAPLPLAPRESRVWAGRAGPGLSSGLGSGSLGGLSAWASLGPWGQWEVWMGPGREGHCRQDGQTRACERGITQADTSHCRCARDSVPGHKPTPAAGNTPLQAERGGGDAATTLWGAHGPGLSAPGGAEQRVSCPKSSRPIPPSSPQPRVEQTRREARVHVVVSRGCCTDDHRLVAYNIPSVSLAALRPFEWSRGQVGGCQ